MKVFIGVMVVLFVMLRAGILYVKVHCLNLPCCHLCSTLASMRILHCDLWLAAGMHKSLCTSFMAEPTAFILGTSCQPRV